MAKLPLRLAPLGPAAGGGAGVGALGQLGLELVVLGAQRVELPQHVVGGAPAELAVGVLTLAQHLLVSVPVAAGLFELGCERPIAVLKLLADGRRPPLCSIVEIGPQFFEVCLLVSEPALDVCQFTPLAGEPIVTLIQRLFPLLQPRFAGLPFFSELRAEGFTCFIELRQHLLPLLDKAALGVDLALADVGLPIQERPLPLGGFAIPLVQSGALFRQLAFPRVEMRPVFRNGRIAAYTMSITHLPDIGGLGFGAAATEIYHEGLRLPVCKLVRAGRLDEPMFDVIRHNVRVPEQVFGDLMANITCNEVGARQLLEFMDEYALDDLAPLSAAIRGQSEQAIRDRIAALPDGIYEGTLDIEGIDDALRLACRAEVDGGGINLDFAGTSPPVDRGINVPLCYTRAMACYAVKCLTVPGMPNNEGAVAPIRVSAPQDSILNAQPPYPTGGRHVTGHMVVPLVFRTLAGAVPGQVQADCGMMNIVTFQGTNPGGRPMSTIYFSTGGFGALQGLDGAETTPGPSNMRTVPTEMWESLTGITIVHKRLLPDTGGHGEARGGLGQEIEFRNDTGAPLTAFCVAPCSEFPARGLFGGGDGSRFSV